MMSRVQRWLALALLLVVALAWAWYCAQRASIVLDAPEPEIVAETVDSLPRLPPSLLEAPVTYDLATAIDSIEAAVPLTYGDLGQPIEWGHNRRVRFSYRLHRSPFRVKVRHQTVSISADIEYSGRI